MTAANRIGRPATHQPVILQMITDSGTAGVTVAEIMARLNSSHTSVSSLIERLRDKGHTLVARRSQHGTRYYLSGNEPNPTPSDSGKAHLAHDILRERIAKAPAAGLSYDEWTAGVSLFSVRRYRARMVKAGEVFRLGSRYYRTAEDYAAADAVRQEGIRLRKNEREQQRKKAGSNPRPTRAKVAKKTPKLIKPEPSFRRQEWIPRPPQATQPTVIPKGLKVQVCPAPTFDARYQVAPGARVEGAGFAKMGIGRYLETT